MHTMMHTAIRGYTCMCGRTRGVIGHAMRVTQFLHLAHIRTHTYTYKPPHTYTHTYAAHTYTLTLTHTHTTHVCVTHRCTLTHLHTRTQTVVGLTYVCVCVCARDPGRLDTRPAPLKAAALPCSSAIPGPAAPLAGLRRAACPCGELC